MKTVGTPANSHFRPVRFSQNVTASSANPASNWFVLPKTGQIARHTGNSTPAGVVYVV
jgi:hypothetical protein